MLIITKDWSRVHSRPKYYPLNRWSCWCVRDTDLDKVIYGPVTHSAAMKFMNDEHNRRLS